MKTLYVFKKSLLATFIFIFIGCGAETLAALIFIPAFAATWNVENNPDYRINLQPNADNKNVPAGVFVGDEQHNFDTDKDGNLITGSFDGLDIEFTIQRPNNVKVKYSGKMQTISDTDHTVIRIVLNSSSEGALVLVP